MRRMILAIAVIGLAGCLAADDLPAANQAVTRFHQMLDAGQFQQIYDQSATEMRQATTGPKLVALLAAVNRKLGTVKSTAQQGWNDQINPGGHFLTIGYKTSFARADGVETFTFRIADKQAKLVGYNINSDALITN